MTTYHVGHLTDGKVWFQPAESLEMALAIAQAGAGLDLTPPWRVVGGVMPPHPTAVYEDTERVWSSEIKWFASA